MENPSNSKYAWEFWGWGLKTSLGVLSGGLSPLKIWDRFWQPSREPLMDIYLQGIQILVRSDKEMNLQKDK